MAKKNKNLLGFFLGNLLLLVVAYLTAFIFAPSPIQAGLVPACGESGACGFCDIVNVFTTLGRWLITGGAGLGLLLIIWAGGGLIMSAGNAEKVSAAKKQILGVIIGLGMILVAFQFVFILIAMTVTPSRLVTAPESINPSEEAQKIASLTNLLGVPWWTICSENDLRTVGNANEGKSDYTGTAACRYWGDGTVCQKLSKDQEKQLAEQLEKGETPINVKRCCKGKCIAGECITEELVQPITSAGSRAPAGGPVQCNINYESNERSARDRIAAIGGIDINNGGVRGGQACGSASYRDYRNNCSSGCTNVGGLQDRVFDYIQTIKNKCGGFTLTGGSESGHSSTGGHSDGLAIDIVPPSYSRFISCLKSGRPSPIGDGSLSFIRAICTTSTYSDFSFGCGDYREAENHFHLTFN